MTRNKTMKLYMTVAIIYICDAIWENPSVVALAITVTITSFITDPLKQIGEGIGEFLRALLKDLPVTLQIPVLLLIALAIIVFMYGGAQAAIHQAVRLPRMGWREDPPPPAVGQRQAPQLREHEDVWEGGDTPQPLQIRQNNGNRVNQAGN